MSWLLTNVVSLGFFVTTPASWHEAFLTRVVPKMKYFGLGYWVTGGEGGLRQLVSLRLLYNVRTHLSSDSSYQCLLQPLAARSHFKIQPPFFTAASFFG